MIKRLFIRNLVLIHEATLLFGPDLNILTGETGSGKSAILTALRLVLGERADVQLVGRHNDLAVIEADLIIKDAEVQIRREIHRSGKNRCFVNDELVSLSELRDLFRDSIELADQGAAYKLADPYELQKLLDTFGQIDITEVTNAFHDFQNKRLALNELRKFGAEIQLEEERLREQLTLLDKVDWLQGEEEELTNAHMTLIQIQTSAEKLSEISGFLTDGQHPILPILKRFSSQVSSLGFPDLENWLQAARANLEEASLYLSTYLANLDFNEERLAKVEDRISEIESIKRRFGRTYEESNTLRENLRSRLSRLDRIEGELALSEKALREAEAHLLSLEKGITKARIAAAELLKKAVITELHDLNIPDACLHIQILPKSSSSTGADDIQWLFTANPGQAPLPLNDGPSGGELSRLLLAIKIALKEKKCLILDEIDGNVGGQTASLLGLKLKELGRSCQIICVTHFVQVAKYAMHHFLVSKKTNGTEAITSLQKLDETNRHHEYNRMTGMSL